MKIHILLFRNFYWLYALLDCLHPSQKFTFLVVLGILDYASSKINAVDCILVSFVALELVSVKLLHQRPSEINQICQSVGFSFLEHTICSSHYSLQEALFAGSKLTRLNADVLSYVSIVVRTNLVEHNCIRNLVRSLKELLSISERPF